VRVREELGSVLRELERHFGAIGCSGAIDQMGFGAQIFLASIVALLMNQECSPAPSTKDMGGRLLLCCHTDKALTQAYEYLTRIEAVIGKIIARPNVKASRPSKTSRVPEAAPVILCLEISGTQPAFSPGSSGSVCVIEPANHTNRTSTKDTHWCLTLAAST